MLELGSLTTVDPIYLSEDFFFLIFHCLRFVQIIIAFRSTPKPWDGAGAACGAARAAGDGGRKRR